jgi:hypothetical protein
VLITNVKKVDLVAAGEENPAACRKVYGKVRIIPVKYNYI